MPTFRGSGDPTSGADIYDQATLDAAVADAAASEAAAAASAAAALTSENNASASEAATAADAIATAADAVSTAADAASTAADAISTAADAASTAADAAATAADVVTTGNDVTYAAEWANKAEDSLVSAAAGGDEVDDYSALHWATKAAASAAALNLPDPITALQYLRGNAGGTAWEQVDLLGQANTWTGLQTFTDNVLVQAAAPQCRMFETDQTDKNWKVQGSGGWFYINQMLDTGADSGTYPFRITDDALNQALTIDDHGMDSNGTIRTTGIATPAAGAGLELAYQSGIGYITAYDRSLSVYKQLTYRALSLHSFQNDGVTRFNIQDNSIQHNGDTNSSVVMNASVNQSAFYYMRENNVNKGLVYYSGVTHSMYLQKYADSSGSTVRNMIQLDDSGTIYLRPAYDSGRNSFIINTGNANMGQYGSLYFGSIWDGATGSYYGLSHSSGGTTSNYMIMANASSTLISTASATGVVYLRGGKNGGGKGQVEVRTTDYRWNSEIQSSYSGQVNSSGTAGKLPSTWSSSRIGVGHYRVTHTAGTTSYNVICTPYTTGNRTCNVAAITTTTFDVYIFAANTAALTDTAFFFHLKLH